MSDAEADGPASATDSASTGAGSAGTGEADAPSGNDVDAETWRSFWSAAFGVNVGLLAVTIGPMLAYFWGWIYVGAILFGVGVAAFWHAYRTYRAYVDDEDDEPETPDVEEEVVP